MRSGCRRSFASFKQYWRPPSGNIASLKTRTRSTLTWEHWRLGRSCSYVWHRLCLSFCLCVRMKKRMINRKGNGNARAKATGPTDQSVARPNVHRLKSGTTEQRTSMLNIFHNFLILTSNNKVIARKLTSSCHAGTTTPPARTSSHITSQHAHQNIKK